MPLAIASSNSNFALAERAASGRAKQSSLTLPAKIKEFDVFAQVPIKGRTAWFRLSPETTKCEISCAIESSYRAGQGLFVTICQQQIRVEVVKTSVAKAHSDGADGVLGWPFLAHCAIGIDFTKASSKLILWRRLPIREASQWLLDESKGSVNRIAWTLRGARPRFPVRFGSKSIDAVLILNSSLTSIPTNRAVPSGWARLRSIKGDSDGSSAQLYNADAIKIGSTTYRSRLVALPMKSGVGIVGADFFGSKRMILDGEGGSIYVSSNSAGAGQWDDTLVSWLGGLAFADGSRLIAFPGAFSVPAKHSVELLAVGNVKAQSLLSAWKRPDRARNALLTIFQNMWNGGAVTVLFDGHAGDIKVEPHD